MRLGCHVDYVYREYQEDDLCEHTSARERLSFGFFAILRANVYVRQDNIGNAAHKPRWEFPREPFLVVRIAGNEIDNTSTHRQGRRPVYGSRNEVLKFIYLFQSRTLQQENLEL